MLSVPAPTRGVGAVPPEALSYLSTTGWYYEGGADITWEESMHYGWGIGHPDHSVAEIVLERVHTDDIWASAAAARALVAAQHDAIDLYCDLLQHPSLEDTILAVDNLAYLEDGIRDEWFPRFWAPSEELDHDFTFRFAEDVEARLRQVLEDTGLASGHGDDWTFADLEFRW